jgi:hypothetical protein
MDTSLVHQQATDSAEAALARLLYLADASDFYADMTRITELAARIARFADRRATATSAPAQDGTLTRRLEELQANGLGAVEPVETSFIASGADSPTVPSELIDALFDASAQFTRLAKRDVPASIDDLGDRAWVADRGLAEADFGRLAAAYSVVGESLIALDAADTAELADALQRCATLQSALRRMLSCGPYWYSCPLQAKVFGCIRALAAYFRIYIPRHLRAADPADPRALWTASRSSPRQVVATESNEEMSDPTPLEVSQLLRAARRRIAGKRLLLIGGDEREYTRNNLKSGLQLGSLRWLEVAPHAPHAPLRQAIASETVDAVALAIRWSSHSYSALVDVARQYGKPMIRLPAGLGVHQVAHQIVTQMS